MVLKKILPLFLVIILLMSCGDGKKAGEGDPKDSAVTKAPADFQYTEKPTLEMIPDKPVYGVANGKDFVIQSIVIEPKFDNWYIVLADKKLEKPTDMLTDCQYLNVELPKEPKSGEIIKREMSSGGGFWQMWSADDPKTTTSYNAQNAFVIEFTKWEVKPWDANPSASWDQVAGKASGKLAVCYQGFSDSTYKNSWVAGTFVDVPIVYKGKPPWIKDEAVPAAAK